MSILYAQHPHSSLSDNEITINKDQGFHVSGSVTWLALILLFILAMYIAKLKYGPKVVSHVKRKAKQVHSYVKKKRAASRQRKAARKR